jgi:hypothetical protein
MHIHGLLLGCIYMHPLLETLNPLLLAWLVFRDRGLDAEVNTLLVLLVLVLEAVAAPYKGVPGKKAGSMSRVGAVSAAEPDCSVD